MIPVLNRQSTQTWDPDTNEGHMTCRVSRPTRCSLQEALHGTMPSSAGQSAVSPSNSEMPPPCSLPRFPDSPATLPEHPACLSGCTPGPCFCSVYPKVPGGWPSRFERRGNQAQTHAKVGTPDRGPEAGQWPGVSQESEWWYASVEHAGEMKETLRAQRITVTRVGPQGLLASPSS